MIISMGHCGGNLWAGIRTFRGLVLVAGLGLLAASCEKEPKITVRDEVKSPDGRWTVKTQYENWSGPGNNSEATSVVISQTGTDREPQEILSFDDDVQDIVVTWRDNHHLELVYRKGPKVTFQVVRFGDIDILATGEAI